ncbi:hypothetical protein, partial [Vibrio parahaemolyticus]|uniref:hypothetical protein n=1 Tax=Vibrio parahaemolyticus TaxID=670 RepID=UPI001C60D29D
MTIALSGKTESCKITTRPSIFPESTVWLLWLLLALSVFALGFVLFPSQPINVKTTNKLTIWRKKLI